MNFTEIFEKYKSIAVVGMSANPMKASHSVPVYMLHNGYNVIPVNPTTEKVLHLKSYKNLTEVPDYIEIVNVFRPSNQCLEVIKEAIERHKIKGDVKLIWLQEGIFCDEGKKLAEENGIEFIQDSCMYKEYVNLD